MYLFNNFNIINIHLLFLTDMSPGPGHPDGALRGGHPVHVPLGPDAHAGPHRQRGLQTLLDGPLHLLDVLEILNLHQ